MVVVWMTDDTSRSSLVGGCESLDGLEEDAQLAIGNLFEDAGSGEGESIANKHTGAEEVILSVFAGSRATNDLSEELLWLELSCGSCEEQGQEQELHLYGLCHCLGG